jgi:3-hydroxy-9,10-secoandrosta-1,3,5(10)-triene-9,17-dione monooxygenase reductase component
MTSRRTMSTSASTTIDPSHYRRVLGHLPTGVSVVTAQSPAGPIGMAANSVTSVSLDPPLVLLCPAKTSTTWPDIRAAGTFCINVMAHHHEQLTRRFAAKDVDRFADVDYENRVTGPVLREALAWIECQLENEHEAGDHVIAVARVRAMGATAELADPLVFFRGSYGSFSTQPVKAGD